MTAAQPPPTQPLPRPESSQANRLRISVVIPTYRRPEELTRCLSALSMQQNPAHEVLVVVRAGDQQSHEAALKSRLTCKIVNVDVPGVVAAMNAGTIAAVGDIIALIDDDAAPGPDWLLRIASWFTADSKIVGVGGRDLIHVNGQPLEGQRQTVGKIQWWGRVVGNHHLGCGQARSVHVLKGVNCAYRARVLKRIGFDNVLRGSGAQVHWELRLGLQIRESGGLLFYDPQIQVNHYPATRFDADQLHRGKFDVFPLVNAVHNETYALLMHAGLLQRLAFCLNWILLGTAAEPGLLQLVRLLLRRDRNALQRWRATVAGRWAGLQTWRCASRELSSVDVVTTPNHSSASAT